MMILYIFAAKKTSWHKRAKPGLNRVNLTIAYLGRGVDCKLETHDHVHNNHARNELGVDCYIPLSYSFFLIHKILSRCSNHSNSSNFHELLKLNG